MRRWNVADWLVLILFAGIVALVFQQIATSMTEQGIASGGPYDNSASYPRILAILIAVFVPITIISRSKEKTGAEAITKTITRQTILRPALTTLIFILFLFFLPILGYHIAAPLMLFSIMYLCGLRGFLQLVLPALLIPISLAYIFEVFLKIVLPGGWFGLNIAW